MYTKEDLKEKLNKNNRNVDIDTISDYLKRWHIDPVYEDENQVEYYDELTIAKLNQGIILKEQENTDEEIMAITNKAVLSAFNLPAPKKAEVQKQEPPKEEKLENITIDVTSQTLSLLADSIADKISNNLAEKINFNNNSQPTTYYDKLKKDNQILASQVEKLLEDNKILAENIKILMQEKAKFKKIYGSFYMKQD